MLMLKFQYFGHLIWRTDSLEKTLMLGEIEGGRRRGQQRWDGWMASPTRWTWVWVSSGSCWWTGRPGVLQSMGSQRLNWPESQARATLLCAMLVYVVLWKRARILEADSVELQSLLCSAVIHLFRRCSLRASHVGVPWQTLGISREQAVGAAGSVNELLKQ